MRTHTTSRDPAPQPPTHEQLAQLAAARRRRRPLQRAATLARVSGWSTGACAAMALVTGAAAGSAIGLAVGAALAVIAWTELAGARMIDRLEPRGPRRLALNQLSLCLVICCYAGWKVAGALIGGGPESTFAATGDPEVDRLLASTEDLVAGVVAGFYGLLAAGSIGVQGLAAWYYGSRARLIREYQRQTPAWAAAVDRD